MQLALLSDIHSNRFALEAVLEEMTSLGINRALILGDIFGYYAWPCATYELLQCLNMTAIKGNHDALLELEAPPTPAPPYWDAIAHNKEALTQMHPEALRWSMGLEFTTTVDVEGVLTVLCHGSPNDPQHGRLYPDDDSERDWFPRDGQALLLGHTHYPLHVYTEGGGTILNPGSLGQPRDGSPMAAWAIMDTNGPSFRFMRTAYDVEGAVAELRTMKWDDRSIRALQKTHAGPLDSDS